MNYRKKVFFLISFIGFLTIFFSLSILLTNFSLLSFLLFIFVIGTVIFILSGVWYFLNQKQETLPKHIKKTPSVAVVCTFFGESTEIIKKTLKCMKELNYSNKNLYLLDDSVDKDKELKRFCNKHKITYITREDRKEFKAGNLNNFLFNYCKEEYLLIFDKDDFKLKNKNLIQDLLPFFKDKIAYVQTKKMTIKGNLFENAIRETNAFFYNIVQPINNKTQTALFGGSLALMKVDIIKKLGGFPNYLIEDVAYSFKAISNGYKGIYVNKSYVLSNKIESFSEFQKQHFRYNFSNTHLLFDYYLKNIFKIPFKFHYHFILQFFGIHFLSLTQVFLCLFIPFFMFFLPFSINILLVFIFLIFLFPLTIILFAKEYTDSYKLGVLAYLINYSLAFTRITAAVKAVLRIKPTSYGVTAIGRKKMPKKEIIKRSFFEIFFFFCLLLPLLYISSNIYIFLILWNAFLFLSAPIFLYFFS